MNCKYCIYRKRKVTGGKDIIVYKGDSVRTDTHISIKCMAKGTATIDPKTMRCSEEVEAIE